MEFYIKGLEEHLAPGYVVVRTSGRDNASVVDGAIAIDTNCLDNCPDIVELHNMLAKRLTPKKKSKGAIDHKLVAICCLASRGYTINHESVHSISGKEMSKIWSTLERSKVSSSSKLRDWISQRISFRSYEGFSGTTGQDKVVALVTTDKSDARVAKIDKATVVSALKVELTVGSSLTVRGAMATDAKLLHAARVCSGMPAPSFETLLR